MFELERKEVSKLIVNELLRQTKLRELSWNYYNDNDLEEAKLDTDNENNEESKNLEFKKIVEGILFEKFHPFKEKKIIKWLIEKGVDEGYYASGIYTIIKSDNDKSFKEHRVSILKYKVRIIKNEEEKFVTTEYYCYLLLSDFPKVHNKFHKKSKYEILIDSDQCKEVERIYGYMNIWRIDEIDCLVDALDINMDEFEDE